MKKLGRPVVVIGQLVDLLIGDSFATPTLQVIDKHPELGFDL